MSLFCELDRYMISLYRRRGGMPVLPFGVAWASTAREDDAQRLPEPP